MSYDKLIASELNINDLAPGQTPVDLKIDRKLKKERQRNQDGHRKR